MACVFGRRIRAVVVGASVALDAEPGEAVHLAIGLVEGVLVAVATAAGLIYSRLCLRPRRRVPRTSVQPVPATHELFAVS